MTFAKCALALAVTMSLAACGGGGGSSGTSLYGSGSGSSSGGTGSTDTVAAAVLALTLSNATVTSGAPATATATLKTAAGVAIPGIVVTFASTAALGSVNATTALTDANGVATVTLYPAASTTSGADTLVATATVNGTALSSSQGFQLTPSNVTVSSFASDVGTASLSAYGQTTLKVALSGVASGASVNVALASACVAKGKATITPASVSTTSGSASFIYKDAGCGSTDAADTVQATVGGTLYATPVRVALTSPAVSSITFGSATPSTIYLKGSGFAESAQVTFLVKDIAGNPLPNQSVVLEATTYAGGLTIDGSNASVTKQSDANGSVTALINSGTVPTPVRVKASLTTASSAVVTTVSSGLSIAVGLPSELNFSLAQGTKNIEGFNINGTRNTYSIIASDRMGNPVPDGTAVNFIAEGGQIQATGSTIGNPTAAGVTVNFQSSDPRPVDGRITILAYALGEESFIDTNGNNVYDAGEAFQDLGNLFLSRGFVNAYDSVSDQFFPNSTATSACAAVTAAKDPLNLLGLNLSIPTIANTCDGAWGKAYVRKAIETVLSTSSARPLWASLPSTTSTFDRDCAAVTLTDDARAQTRFLVFGAGGLYSAPASGTVGIIVSDANTVRLNPMAAGTTVSAVATAGLTVTMAGGSPVPNTTLANQAGVSYAFASGTTSGTISVNFTSPSGLTTTVPLVISTDPPTTSCPL
jgi:hypothetical protein